MSEFVPVTFNDKTRLVPRKSYAILFSDFGGKNYRRRWLLIWVGQLVGPLLMAILKAKSIGFGVTDGDSFKWIEIERAGGDGDE